ncbi:MGMT family protein [Candidatus Synechococcus spongiarum]|uniref:MGMT family protein n=1 Tax=Candidatus Synechococcus spongiarum TaxID=431041 RepID=UPI0004BC8482|nr:MGMT family protein [Candidatus Synechococcus spongiarum]
MPPTAQQRILQVTAMIPRGTVTTYGRVAELAGYFGAARQVGWVLRRQDPADTTIPWHRVVNATGAISMSTGRNGSDWIQRELLLEEGVPVDRSGRLPLRAYLWMPDPLQVLQDLAGD